MRSLHHVLGRIRLSTFKKFTALLPNTRKKYGEVLALASTNREKIEKLLPDDFSWAMLYELQAKELFILSLAALGFLDKLSQAARAGLDINQFLMEAAIREEENENGEFEWSGGHGGLFTEADTIATTHATQNSWRCLSIYGQYLNDLVKLVREGNDGADDAYFKAVNIDRTVLTCPTFAARLARAEYFGEKKFIFRLRKAVKGKPHDSLLLHQDLRTVLQFFHEINTISLFTLDEADLLFIKELKVYQDAGKDPARSLMRFIQRWKAEKSPAT